MKQLIKLFLISFVIFLCGINKGNVLADEVKCSSVGQLLLLDKKHAMNPSSGVTVKPRKYLPNNVVVIGQDPTREGVTIKVTVQQMPGSIDYERPVTTFRCTHYSKAQSGRETCPARSSPDYDGTNYYYYLDSETYCQPTNTLDDNIDVRRRMISIKIWLQPSLDTFEWLGWSATTSRGRSALRFLFPEKWMVGNWTDYGFVTRGAQGNIGFSTDYYKQWLEKMGQYDFLAGDSMGDNAIWSISLPRVISPLDNKTNSLGMMGVFDNALNTPSNVGGASYYSCPSIPPDNHSEDVGWTPIETNSNCSEVLPDAGNDFTHMITLNNVPLDLPGEWFIGVAVEMIPAVFEDPDGTYHTEAPGWGVEVGKWFLPQTEKNFSEIGYNLGEAPASFFSYILLSTPCNGQEVNGCFDGTP